MVILYALAKRNPQHIYGLEKVSPAGGRGAGQREWEKAENFVSAA